MHGNRIDALEGLLERKMVDRKMTAGCRAGSGAPRRGQSRPGGIFVKLRSLQDLAVFSGFLRVFEIRTRSGCGQDAVRMRSGRDQNAIRVGSGLAFRRKVCADRLLDGKRHRGKRHLMFCSLSFLSVVFSPRVRGDPAAPRRAGRRRGGRRELGSMLSGDNISPYIYLIDALCEFSKFFCRTPCHGRFRAASSRCNCLCVKGLRRRFRMPEKYFSGELSNWLYLALFETAAPGNHRSSRGPA